MESGGGADGELPDDDGLAESLESGPDEPVAALEEAGDDPVVVGVLDGEELMQVGCQVWRCVTLLVGDLEVSEGQPGSKVRGGIFVRACGLHHVDGVGNALQAGRYLPGVCLARLVLVGDDEHPSVAEELGVLWAPLPGAAGIARCGGACALEGLDVFLALGHPDDFAVRYRLDDLRELVQDAAGVIELPVPARFPGTVGPALRELLVLRPEYLEQQGPGLVGVVVYGYRLAEWRPLACGALGLLFVVAEVGPCQADGG